jgi:hypothetical protein
MGKVIALLVAVGAAVLAVPTLAGADQGAATNSYEASATTFAAARTAACKPGLTKVGGAQLQVYCGPARATTTFGGRSVSFVNGSCARATKAFAINVGRATIPPAKPKYSYFGITMGKLRGDRTYKNVAVGFQWRGKAYSVVSNAVTIKRNGTRGMFTGRLNGPGGVKVSGSFTC